MRIVADFQVHSKYSRACSKDLSLENLEKYARIKGLDILGTGDFQHPIWNKEIKTKLQEDDKGILRTKTGFPFIWQTEVSLMYSQGGKGRRIHFLIYAPNRGVADQITEFLGKKGRLDYDGRPIFGFSGIELVENMVGISKEIEIIPAHAWTPWFGLFGSKSGFDSLQDCFQEKTKYIHAIETGLSSDPKMNWRLSKLDNINLVSFSDAHSFWPNKLGREATVFDLKELSYEGFIKAIRTGQGLTETLEFFPEQCKYHWDGHRDCSVFLSPKDSKKLNSYCPKCGKLLTIGVEYRVEQLADRAYEEKPKGAKPFKSLIPLLEIIQISLGLASPFSKKCWELYYKFLNKFGTELSIILDLEKEKLEEVDKLTADLITKIRQGQVKFRPGADGEFGVPYFDKEQFDQDLKLPEKKQKNLLDF